MRDFNSEENGVLNDTLFAEDESSIVIQEQLATSTGANISAYKLYLLLRLASWLATVEKYTRVEWTTSDGEKVIVNVQPGYSSQNTAMTALFDLKLEGSEVRLGGKSLSQP